MQSLRDCTLDRRENTEGSGVEMGRDLVCILESVSGSYTYVGNLGGRDNPGGGCIRGEAAAVVQIKDAGSLERLTLPPCFYHQSTTNVQ